MNNKKNEKLKRILIGLSSVCLVTACSKKETDYSLETDELLKTYNTYLEKLGSEEKINIEDVEKINHVCNDGIITIKLNNGDYVQVGLDDYKLIEKDGDIKLQEPSLAKDYDLFTKTDFTYNYEYSDISYLGDYIEDNNIESIGYIAQCASAWSDKDKEFIETSYNEDVLECLNKNGYPLALYDVNDFYEAYESNKGYTRNLTK